jgi:hypothetical protein
MTRSQTQAHRHIRRLLLLTAVAGGTEEWRTTPVHYEQPERAPGPSPNDRLVALGFTPASSILSSGAAATELVARSSVCTLILAGALWDGHFKAFVKSGLIQEVRDLRPDVDIVALLYDGSSAGHESALPPLSTAWAAEGTLASYELRAFRGGIDLGEVRVRQWRSHTEGGSLLEDISAACDAGEVDEGGWDDLDDGEEDLVGGIAGDATSTAAPAVAAPQPR